jgi:hypothetical protein
MLEKLIPKGKLCVKCCQFIHKMLGQGRMSHEWIGKKFVRPELLNRRKCQMWKALLHSVNLDIRYASDWQTFACNSAADIKSGFCQGPVLNVDDGSHDDDEAAGEATTAGHGDDEAAGDDILRVSFAMKLTKSLNDASATF